MMKFGRNPSVGPFLISDLNLMTAYANALNGKKVLILSPTKEMMEITIEKVKKLVKTDILPENLRFDYSLDNDKTIEGYGVLPGE